MVGCKVTSQRAGMLSAVSVSQLATMRYTALSRSEGINGGSMRARLPDGVYSVPLLRLQVATSPALWPVCMIGSYRVLSTSTSTSERTYTSEGHG
jgi:hypothetical protein